MQWNTHTAIRFGAPARSVVLLEPLVTKVTFKKHNDERRIRIDERPKTRDLEHEARVAADQKARRVAGLLNEEM